MYVLCLCVYICVVGILHVCIYFILIHLNTHTYIHAGQEVAKAVSQKHHPVYQFVYLDAFEILCDYESAAPEDFALCGSR